MNEKLPRGILGFPVTPFNKQGQLDEQALAENIRFLVREGLEAIFVCAGAGEFQSLAVREYEAMVEVAVAEVKGRVPVYTGVGGNISAAVELATISEQKGADGYLILPPYLIHGEQEGLFQYFKTIIESTPLKAIIYQRDHAVFSVDTVQRLSEYPQVIGLKDGYGNIERNIELTQALGDRLIWMNGMPLAEVTMPAYYAIGFDTYSSAISNYIPHISRMFFEALKQNHRQLVHELYQKVILPIHHIRKMKKGYAVSLIKAGMEIMGLPVGQHVRPPIIPVEKEHYSQLEKIIGKALESYPPTRPSSTF